MSHHLSIGLGLEPGTFGDQLVAQLLEVLNDAIVDDRDAVGDMRMGIGFAGPPMGRPAGMADTHHPRQRRVRQQRLEIGQLALGPASVDMAVHQGSDTGGIIAAIGKALQSLDEERNRRPIAKNADDAAHGISSPLVPLSIYFPELQAQSGFSSWRSERKTWSADVLLVIALP